MTRVLPIFSENCPQNLCQSIWEAANFVVTSFGSFACTPQEDVMTIERVLQEELNSLNNWFHENGLIVNCSKTNVVVFGTSQSLVKSGMPVIKLSDSFLPVKEFCKYLGVIFDSNLNWHRYIDTIALKVSCRLGLLSRIRKYISIDVCKYLHHNSIVQLFI